jgi:hypothetical protein
MVLFKSSLPSEEEQQDSNFCWPYMYAGQEGFQKFLVVIALCCVPWMLFGKPYMIRKQRMLQQNKVRDLVQFLTSLVN